MSLIVIVTEQRNAELTSAAAISYASPPHSEPEARKLVELLSGVAPSGEGPWRQAIAGGQRTIELRQASA
ncbi:MAG: hypothetical protein ACLP0J_09510 [Solirubrobacteraceae bacterium]|jgi:hypothetical protein